MPLLEVTQLTKHYQGGSGHVTALEDVSFALEGGRLLGVLGPSGSGKTTLLSLIAGLLRPSSGEVRLGGSAVHLRSARESAAFRREHVGLVFQDHHLVPYLSALDNLLLVPHLRGRVRKADRQHASHLLTEFGLEHRAYHAPAELSGGERQRVAIARALMNSPEIMLVDEPTSNLDTERGQQVLELLRDQVHRGAMTCVMVTHDPRMAAQADQTLRLVDGRVVTNSAAS
ncbi:MAG: ABC transporter ATP-binding protein [Actinobacteria bacterium]|nr:ABC transporter ATP-binding protein [Actinomycetota bacterium]